MINLPAVFVANAVGVFLMIILLISNRARIRSALFDERLFILMTFLTMMQCIVEIVTFVIDGKVFTGSRSISVILNSYLFAADIFFAYIWTVYLDYKLFEDIKRLKRIYPFVGIPAYTVIFLSAVNLFTEVFFKVSGDNVYSRSPMVFVTYLVTYGYLIYSIVLVYVSRKKTKRYLFLPVLIFLLPIFVGSLCQFLFYGLSLIWVSVAAGMVSLYINLQNEVSFIDHLTGLYNRQYLDRYLNSIVQKQMDGKVLGGIMLDVDDFKSINDSFGHAAGDAALREAGKILYGAAEAGDFAARYGGDEFVIIKRVTDLSKLFKMMDKIQNLTESLPLTESRPYTLSFSMGYSIYEGREDTTDSFLRRMDERMYEEKRKKKEVSILTDKTYNVGKSTPESIATGLREEYNR